MADWTPENGDQAEWLATWQALGLRPEYPWSPTVVVVNGRKVARYSLIRDQDGSAQSIPLPGKGFSERPHLARLD